MIIGKMYVIKFKDITQEKILVDKEAYLKLKNNKEIPEDIYKKEMKKLTKGKEWFTTDSDFAKGILNGSGEFKHFAGITQFTIIQKT